MEGFKKATDDVLSLFQTNPFATPVGIKIEQATDPTLASENWQLNMEICDMINSNSEEFGKDAVRAIKKRLLGKNYTCIMYTLICLETCVKNCNSKFHSLVCSRDFINELVKVIGVKNDAPLVVQEKVLGLIQSWADTFKNEEGVVEIYHDLKSKGIEFPMTDLDSMAPILTPSRRPVSASAAASTVVVSSSEGVDERVMHPVSLPSVTMRPKTTPEQSEKLRRDLAVVQGNVSVFSELLDDNNNQEEDLVFLKELYETCKEMQQRIAALLCNINSTEEDLLGELLIVNDQLNNLFLRYGRYIKNLDKASKAEKSLIDFGSGGGGGSGGHNTDDFEAFAKARTTGEKNEPEDFCEEDEILKTHTPAEFDEMEAWLKTNASGSMSSSDFDKFLNERAASKK